MPDRTIYFTIIQQCNMLTMGTLLIQNCAWRISIQQRRHLGTSSIWTTSAIILHIIRNNDNNFRNSLRFDSAIVRHNSTTTFKFHIENLLVKFVFPFFNERAAKLAFINCQRAYRKY